MGIMIVGESGDNFQSAQFPTRLLGVAWAFAMIAVGTTPTGPRIRRLHGGSPSRVVVGVLGRHKSRAFRWWRIGVTHRRLPTAFLMTYRR